MVGLLWFAHLLAASGNDGRTWDVTRLAAPLDLRATYEEGIDYDGTSLGPMQDIAGFRHGFGAAFVVGPPLVRDGRTHARYPRLRSGQRSRCFSSFSASVGQ